MVPVSYERSQYEGKNTGVRQVRDLVRQILDNSNALFKTNFPEDVKRMIFHFYG